MMKIYDASEQFSATSEKFVAKLGVFGRNTTIEHQRRRIIRQLNTLTSRLTGG